MSESVRNFDVYIEIEIFEYEDGKFDWWASNGEESRQLFDSADDAETDARRRFS